MVYTNRSIEAAVECQSCARQAVESALLHKKTRSILPRLILSASMCVSQCFKPPAPFLVEAINEQAKKLSEKGQRSVVSRLGWLCSYGEKSDRMIWSVFFRNNNALDFESSIVSAMCERGNVEKSVRYLLANPRKWHSRGLTHAKLIAMLAKGYIAETLLSTTEGCDPMKKRVETMFATARFKSMRELTFPHLPPPCRVEIMLRHLQMIVDGGAYSFVA